MARLTVLSNKINPIQEQNMKMLPLICFDHVKSVRIDYDLSKTKTMEDGPEINNSRVSYYLTIDESKENNHLQNRFLYLEGGLRNLFWKEICVEVYFNNKIVYKSANL